MKTEDLIILGAVAAGGYFLYKTLRPVSDGIGNVTDATGDVISSVGTGINTVTDTGKSLVKPIIQVEEAAADAVSKILNVGSSIPEKILNAPKALIRTAKDAYNEVSNLFNPLPVISPYVWSGSSIPINQSNAYNAPLTEAILIQSQKKLSSSLNSSSSTKKAVQITTGSTGYNFSKDLTSSNAAVKANAEAMIKKLNKK